jgi:solute carrier family 30 (zinc transporter), member 5/7
MGISPYLINLINRHIGHSHDHDHNHNHHHNSNMHGIFLHVLADTLGSVGVIVSTLLIRHFNWSGFDPLASIFIAILILMSTIPLLQTTASSLLLLNSYEQEYTLRDVLGEVSVIPGVSQIETVKLWEDGGSIKVRIKKDDLMVVRERVGRLLDRKGFEGVYVDAIRG